MDRWVKLTVASSVLLFGIGVALMYRNHSLPGDRATSVKAAGASVLRQYTGPQTAPPARPQSRPEAIASQEVPVAARRRVTIRGPLEPGDPPPKLARRYPDQDAPLAMDALPPPIDYRLPEPSDSKPATRIHKIVDGDTLAALAEYYLGSTERQREIYEMNRNVLPDPAVLPIGVELKIPPRAVEAPRVEEAPAERPLVPVAQ